MATRRTMSELAAEREHLLPQRYAYEGEKRCHRCGEFKPLEAFARSSRNAGLAGKGRATNCRPCESERQRAMRLARAGSEA